MMISTPVADSIKLHYEPIAISGGSIVGFESLLRWHHQQRDEISPEAFIPIFEESALIRPLSRWALEQACQEAVSWSLPLHVSVNLSAVLFRDEDLPALVRAVLAQTGLDPGRLWLEMTAAALIENPEKTSSTLRGLRDLNVHIALDEVGSRASSPSFLWNYPFSRMSIARNIVDHIRTSSLARSVVRGIIRFGHSLNVTIAAKGVETDEELAYLIDEGCDLIQGFLVGRAAPIASFVFVDGVVRLSDRVDFHDAPVASNVTIKRHLNDNEVASAAAAAGPPDTSDPVVPEGERVTTRKR